MAITMRPARALCTKSKLPASDYVINPYVGCTHACKYCYAGFMGRFTGHREPWGSYIEAKVYDSYRLPHDLAGKTILIGSVTDAYNPAERSCHRMPDILRALAGCSAHVEILTKSDLVLRDTALLRDIPDVSVGVSLSNLNAADNTVLEPGASSAEERLQTLRELHESGLHTYLFIAPYLPGVTDMKAILAEAGPYVDYACVENLNLRGAAKGPFLQRMEELHPELTELYHSIYTKGDGGAYWKTLEEKLPKLEAASGVTLVSYLYHEKIRKK